MKKLYKPLIAIVLCISFVFAFAACGRGESFDPTELKNELNDALAELDALKADLSSLEAALFIYRSILIGNWDGENSTYTTSNRVRAGLRYMEFGEYPCNYVGDTLNTTLTNAYNGGGLATAAIKGLYSFFIMKPPKSYNLIIQLCLVIYNRFIIPYKKLLEKSF